MVRGAQQATVHELARVGHNLATKPPPPCPPGHPSEAATQLAQPPKQGSQQGSRGGILKKKKKNPTALRNDNLKRYMYAYVHSSTIYNSQNMETS